MFRISDFVLRIYMYLLLDLSEKTTLHLALFDESAIVHSQTEGINRELLSCIDAFLKEQHLNTKDVQGIMVVVGSGGFTSTRIATTVANGFAYALQVPLLAITQDQVDEIQQLIPQLLKQPRGQYISATYNGEPNITQKVQKV